MAPKTPSINIQKPKVKQDGVTRLAGFSASSPSADLVLVDYAEVQKEEIEVLQAIYMDDYEEVEIKSAWSKASDRAFKLRIKSFSDEKTFVILSVRLTVTYPKTPPLLHVEGHDHLHSRTQARITRITEQRPAAMIGEVMIHTIASDIQDALEDAVQAREQGVLPSLEDVRAIQEATNNEQTREQEDAEAKREQEAQAEEDRVLQKMVEEEVERREAKKKGTSAQQLTTVTSDLNVISDSNIIRFDQAVTLTLLADEVSFDSVQPISTISAGPGANVLAVKPRVPAVHNESILAVRCVQLGALVEDVSGKHDILALEEELEALKALRNPNVVNLHAFKMERKKVDFGGSSISWHVTVLMDFANRGSLAELLEDGQTVPLERARQWSVDLLEALDFYHRHGIVHKSIDCKNVLITRTTGGITAPLLAGAAYQHRLHRIQSSVSSNNDARDATLWKSPELTKDQTSYTRRSDIWDFGCVLVQMLLGSVTPAKYSSPMDLLSNVDFSDALDNLLRKIFDREPRRRPSAFDLVPCEFFRSNSSILAAEASASGRRQSTATAPHGQKSPLARRSRHNSTSAGDSVTLSRYVNEFIELHRLGKGGFGEVVKARNKTDGGIYAVKKVKQDSRAQLEQVLSEVMLLWRLNHAYVVRYYTAWVEDDVSGSVELDESAVTTSEDFTTTSEDTDGIEFGLSSRGLDFVSSSGYNNIEFGEDDEDGDADSDGSVTDREDRSLHNGFFRSGDSTDGDACEDSEESRPVKTQKPRAVSRRAIRSTLYIQMEYCERHTLRDLIRRDMHAKPEEGWQMIHQILEGLAHIHGHGIIHRDLKPDNIFMDAAGNPRIGDFGLATTSRYQTADKIMASHNTGGEMTRSVGTALYVAPELRTGSGTSYNDKVDMYSLGIIFFEMCFPLPTAMERQQVLTGLREKDHPLPSVFQSTEKTLQGSIIDCLISHVPSERPSSMELLRSGKLPLQIEDETIRQALRSLSDTSSPYYQKMMSALFSQTEHQRVKDIAWDANDNRSVLTSAADLRLRDIARQTLGSIFRRHGAEETQRAMLLPRSGYYTNPNIVQLLDSTGSLLQLPYDLTLPHARHLARTSPVVHKTYAFGHVYRDTGGGGAPRANGEVDFDISSPDDDDLDLHEAEVIKTVDEIIEAVPALSSSPMCFHLNHSDLLDTVLEFCRVEKSQRLAVKEILSKLNFHQWSWPKVRAELRSPLLGVSSTSLDDLAQFDFRDSPEKAIARLETLFEGTSHTNRIQRPVSHLRRVIEALHLFGVHRQVMICPLASYNEKFYVGGIIFQCVHDKKNRSVFAAGGRYDHLIDSHRARGQIAPTCHAVGVNIGLDGLIASMSRYKKNITSGTYIKKGAEESQASAWDAKRCDVLLASNDPTVLRSFGIKLLTSLWSNSISAELGTESRTIDDLLGRQRDSSYTFIVMLKHEASSTVKVRNTLTDTDSEVASAGLVPHIRHELRERDLRSSKASNSMRGSRTAGRPPPLPPALLRHASHPEAGERERKSNNVQVLMAQHRGKKSNKYHIVEAAQQKWAERVDEWKDAPILAVETRDDVLESLREARLSDAESWKKVVQSVQVGERQYLQQVQDLLGAMRKRWIDGDSVREACVFNFRTGTCVYYDLGL